MAKTYPDTVPAAYVKHPALEDAYRRGWNHGHGIACHNVPRLGETYRTDSQGRVTADAESIRDIHQDLCFEAESNSRQYSPFEFTAHEFNSAPDESEDENEMTSEELWEAFDAGTSDAIFADLASYTDEDYGVTADA